MDARRQTTTVAALTSHAAKHAALEALLAAVAAERNISDTLVTSRPMREGAT